MMGPSGSTELLEKAGKYLPPDDLTVIDRAYQFADKAHAGQLRKSKEPYILHPLEVGKILAELEQDVPTICAALLHDTIEDTPVTDADLTQEFGAEICMLVQGVTKLGRIYFGSKEEEQAENLRKMFLAMANDLRVVLIKLADRLHNMRTLRFHSPEKQRRVALETREIFSPLAHRLGMWMIKWELEDLAFYYLEYDEFQRVKRLVASRREERESYISNFIKKLEEMLSKTAINAQVAGRPKHFYSIYMKLKKHNMDFDELYDVLGTRVLVDSVSQCYEVLGIVHSAFKPITGRFKDYIAMPKSNMYQSLHTTVIGPEGKPVEVQIRTREMHQVAEYGIAAHWRYKEGRAETHVAGDFSWLRQIIENQKEEFEPSSYLQNLKVDLFIDEVFIFTPRGDVQVLPSGSTPIDFAYKIHTDIGHSCIGAKVNQHIVPLNYKLKNGDRIEIMTSKVLNPKLDWLNFVRTNQAKSKIKQWFRKQNQANNIQKGKNELEKALLEMGYVLKDVFTDEITDRLLRKQKVTRLDDVYLQLAHGEVGVKTLVNYLDGLFKTAKPETDQEIMDRYKGEAPAKPRKNTVKVLGEDDIEVFFAKCCSPVPGDDIVGFVTLGRGVAIHRTSCPNIMRMDEQGQSRIVSVDWGTTEASNRTYLVTLKIDAFDRIGLLKDIVDRITEQKVHIQEVRTLNLKLNRVGAVVSINVRNREQMNHVMHALQMIPDVFDIYRITQ